MAPVKIRIKRATPVSKPRKSNWDLHEILSLLDAYEAEREELSDGSNKWRRSIWKRVTTRLYPADSPFRRTPAEVRKKWRNLCAAFRLEANKSYRKRGGKAEPLSPLLKRVADLIASETPLKKVLKSPAIVTMSSKRKMNKSAVAEDMVQSQSSPTPSTSSSSSTDSSSSTSMEPQSPSSSNAVSTMETILPTLAQGSSTRDKTAPALSIMKDAPIPFIKEEPLSPVPERSKSLQVQKEVETANKTKSLVSLAKAPTPILTFATATSTSATTAPSPLRVISIVNPISSTGSRTINSCSTGSRTINSCSTQKLILKPINSLANLAKPSTSNVVVVNPKHPPTSAPPLKRIQPQPQVFLQPRNLGVTWPRITDSDALQFASERLHVEQERLQVEKETLEVEREKMELKKQKLGIIRERSEFEIAHKRALLENKKLQLGNKKLKSEIVNLALEKELLSLQIRKLQES